MHYILLDSKTARPWLKETNHRVIGNINGKVDFHCGIMPKKEGGFYVNIGSTLCKKLKLKEGDSLTVTFRKDSSAYQFEMPQELSTVLATDRNADQLFHALTEGTQRGLIYLVTQVKSTDKRIERALRIAEQLKNGVTSPRVILKK
jgi:predicted SPOUT superfamily RNA methylase MTH1